MKLLPVLLFTVSFIRPSFCGVCAYPSTKNIITILSEFHCMLHRFRCPEHYFTFINFIGVAFEVFLRLVYPLVIDYLEHPCPTVKFDISLSCVWDFLRRFQWYFNISVSCIVVHNIICLGCSFPDVHVCPSIALLIKEVSCTLMLLWLHRWTDDKSKSIWNKNISYKSFKALKLFKTFKSFKTFE